MSPSADSFSTLPTGSSNAPSSVSVSSNAQQDVLNKLAALIERNNADTAKVIQDAMLHEVLNFKTIKEGDANKIARLDFSDPKNEIILKVVIAALNNLTPEERQIQSVKAIFQNPNIENAWNQSRKNLLKEKNIGGRDIPSVNRAFLMGANRKRINMPIENKENIDSISANKNQRLGLLPKDELNSSNIEEQGLIALKIIRNIKETMDLPSINKEWHQSTFDLIKHLDANSEKFDSQKIFDVIFKQTLEQYKKTRDLYLEQSQNSGDSVADAPPDPNNGIPVAFGDIGAHDLSAPAPLPGAPPTPPESVFDKLGDCSINLIEVMLWVMLGDGTFPGVYKLNNEKIAKEADQLEAYLQYIENLRKCYDDISEYDNNVPEHEIIFTEKLIDPTTGSLTTITKTMTAADFLQYEPSPKGPSAGIILKFPQPGSGETWSDLKQQDLAEIQGAITQSSGEQTQVQTTVTNDQQTMNSNLETSKNIISQVTDLEKTACPKPL